jgi:hypothetical protein
VDPLTHHLVNGLEPRRALVVDPVVRFLEFCRERVGALGTKFGFPGINQCRFRLRLTWTLSNLNRLVLKEFNVTHVVAVLLGSPQHFKPLHSDLVKKRAS